MTALRHLVAWSTVVLSLVPAAGLAQDATAGASISGSGSGRLDIQGEAPSACVLSPPEVTAVINASFQPANGQASILVTQLADPQTAVPLAATVSLAFPVVCNGAHQLTVSTANGGLIHVPPVALPGQGFRAALPYQITAVWGGQTVTGLTNQPTPVDIGTHDGAAGELSLVVDIPGGGAPLVAGAYTDSLVIELLPAN